MTQPYPGDAEDSVKIDAEDVREGSSWGVDDEHLRRVGEYIYKRPSGRSLYYLMRFLMFMEGVWWGLMDITRALRMRVAKRISEGYQHHK